MASKIRVYGEAQNRTALGIVHAYMKLYPDATLVELREAFPDALAPDKGVAEIFIDKGFNDYGDHYFTEADELIDLSDGTKVAVAKNWSKDSYNNLVKRAADYDIEVAEFEQQKQVGKKGSYYIEYVNGYDPDAVVTVQDYERDRTRRGCAAWMWWLLLAIIAVVILAFIIGRCCSSHDEAAQNNEGIVETTIVAVDETSGQDAAAATAADATASTDATAADAEAAKAAAVAQIEQYQKAFDDVEYPVGQYMLKPEAKTILDSVVKVMKENPGVKLTVNGYASREGNPEANKVLSQKRADSVVEYLESQGIASDRLKAAGLGTTNPVSGELSPNRRIDFVVE